MEGEESMGIFERVAHQWEAWQAVACSGTDEGGKGHKSGGLVDGIPLKFGWREKKT